LGRRGQGGEARKAKANERVRGLAGAHEGINGIVFPLLGKTILFPPCALSTRRRNRPMVVRFRHRMDAGRRLLDRRPSAASMVLKNRVAFIGLFAVRWEARCDVGEDVKPLCHLCESLHFWLLVARASPGRLCGKERCFGRHPWRRPGSIFARNCPIMSGLMRGEGALSSVNRLSPSVASPF